MKYALTLLVAGLLLPATLLAEDADIDLSKLPPPSEKKDVTFEKDIQPIFKASCVRCHSGERPKHHLRLDTLENALKGGEDGKVIIPGKSEKDPLVIAVSRLNPKMAMPPEHHKGRGPGRGGPPGGGPAGGPPDGPPPGPQPNANETNDHGDRPSRPRREMGPPPKPLTAEQVGLIRAWIDQGAK